MCTSRLIHIRAAKSNLASEKGLTNGSPVTWNDLAFHLKGWGGGPLTCPKGGIYALMPIGENPTCSYTSTVRRVSCTNWHCVLRIASIRHGW